MSDMSAVIVPKSDQLNGENLLGGPITIRIREVSVRPGTEQPVSVFYDGDEGKPWKPCKTMSKLMVHAWGNESKEYPGRSMTLYRDPDVKWGGLKVGGIRVSHMTDINPKRLSDGKMVVALQETKGKHKVFTVLPLTAPTKPDPLSWATAIERRITDLDPEITPEWWDSDDTKAQRRVLYKADKARHDAIAASVAKLASDLEAGE